MQCWVTTFPVSDPEVKFITGPQEVIELKINFAFLFSRELYLRTFLPKPRDSDDPSLVIPNINYPSNMRRFRARTFTRLQAPNR